MGADQGDGRCAWPECGNGPVDPVESPRYHSSGRYDAYYSPYPLSERDFLVSANRGGKFVLYLMDVDGNRELIYEGTHHVFHAMPLKARSKPPVMEERGNFAAKGEAEDGVIYSSSVYQGAPEELRGWRSSCGSSHRPQDLHVLVQAAIHLDGTGGVGGAVGRGEAYAGDSAD